MADAPSPELTAAAEGGDAEAQNDVGRFYAALGSADAMEIAAFWFGRAADQGLPKAMHNLGVLAQRAGRSAWARTWFAAAAERGWLNSAVALGVLLEEDGREEEAVQLYEAAAEKGNADAQDRLGERALKLDTEEGYFRAKYWSELSATQGHDGGEARLGLIYHEGLGVERDPKRAVAHWMRAARKGHPGARFMLAVAYEVGAGVDVDRIESAFWYSLVASENPQARYMLNSLALSSDEKAVLRARLRQAVH